MPRSLTRRTRRQSRCCTQCSHGCTGNDSDSDAGLNARTVVLAVPTGTPMVTMVTMVTITISTGSRSRCFLQLWKRLYEYTPPRGGRGSGRGRRRERALRTQSRSWSRSECSNGCPGGTGTEGHGNGGHDGHGRSRCCTQSWIKWLYWYRPQRPTGSALHAIASWRWWVRITISRSRCGLC
eukprot:1741487-Rhodomonas_salina.1